MRPLFAWDVVTAVNARGEPRERTQRPPDRIGTKFGPTVGTATSDAVGKDNAGGNLRSSTLYIANRSSIIEFLVHNVVCLLPLISTVLGQL